MKTLNIRFLGVLALCAAVVGVCVHFLHGFQVAGNAEMFLREAEQAKAAGDRWKAIQNLQKYLGLESKDIEAEAELGMLLADVAENRHAYVRLEKVLRSDPDRTEVRRKLVDVAIELRRFSDARVHLEKLLAISPADHELLARMGRCYAAVGDYTKAVEQYTKAVESKPDEVEVYARLAGVYRVGLERPDEADRWMERLVGANPDSAEAHVLRARHLRVTRKPAEAAQSASRALELAPENPEALVLATQCAAGLEEFDQARQYAHKLIELQPKRVAAYVTLADVETRAGSRGEAIRCVERGLEAIPGQSDLLWTLALLVVEEGQVEKAQATARQLREAEYSDPLVRYLEARIELAQGHWLAARRQLEPIRGELTGWPDLLKRVDFSLGKCYQELGNTDQQLTAYRRAVGADPFWVPARAGLAAALLSTGRIDEALQEFRQIMSMDRAQAAGWIDLARLTVLKNLRLNPEDRNWPRAERMLDLAKRANPEAAAVPILGAEVLVAQGRSQEAATLLTESREGFPESVEVELALAALAQRQRDWDGAVEVLKAAKEKFGDSVALRLGQTQYLVRRYGAEAAEKIRGLADGAETLPEEDLPRLWGGLAMAALRTGDYEQARLVCRRLSEAEPNKLKVWLLLFDLALRAEDDSDIERVLGEIERIEGHGPLWQYGRALYLTLQGEEKALKEALALLSRAGVSRPAWARVPFLAARVHERLEEEELALQQYTHAIELGERNVTAVRRAIQLLSDRQRFVEADRLIRRLEEQYNPFSPDLARLAADVSMRLDDFDRALEMARQAAAGSELYRDHIWLGQVLGILGQRAKREGRTADAERMLAEAESELRRAAELAPDATEAWVAIIQFLARSGQEEQCEKAIAEAQKNIPEGMAPLALAQCYEAMGRMEEAEENYQQALAAGGSDSSVVRQVAEFYLRTGRPEPAETQLRRITAGEVDAEEDDLVWGRRGLALILADRGSYDSLQQGLALVEENLAKEDPDVQDQRAKAILLSAHPKRRKREESIAILERVVERRQVSTPKDRFVLARLYLAKRDWANANRHMRALLASHGNEPQYVGAYVEMLLARKEIQEAELWMRRLRSIAADGFATVRLQARLLYERGEYDGSIVELKGFVEKSAADAADRPVRTGLIAASLSELALRARRDAERMARSKEPEAEARQRRFEEAASRYTRETEAMYRRYMADRPEAAVLLGAFLARLGRAGEALDLVEQAWEESPPAILAATLVVLLQETNASRSELERAETILAKGLEKYERATPLLTILADLRSIQGRCDEAEALYREILAKGRNVEAMNNLAVLLVVQGKQLDEAKRLLDEAIEFSGPTANLLDSRAMLWIATGRPEKAVSDLEEVAAEGISPSLLFHQAQALSKVGKRSAAEQVLARAEKAGLRAEMLHPLERPAYAKLRMALAMKP